LCKIDFNENIMRDIVYVEKIIGHGKKVNRLRFRPFCKELELASCSYDNTVRIFRVRS